MIVVYFVSLALLLFYVAIRLRFELQMLQQNSYRPARYGRWLWTDFRGSGGVDRVTDLLMLGIVVGFFHTRWGAYAVGAVALIALYKGVKILRTPSKKPLVFTPRAARLWFVAFGAVCALVLLLVGMVVMRDGDAMWAVVAATGAMFFALVILMAAWVLLWPLERLINGWYVRDARRILRGMPGLVVVGITGSYGKTSTKHYLYRILSERFSVVMTPGSYNTTLGVVRTIREQLKPYTEVFIVEMGAKNVGDVAEICDIVHSRIGILTSVGEQHLESFKTIENVQRAKFELIDALPPDGVAILNDDFEYIRNRPVEGVGCVLRYSYEQAAEAVKRGDFTTRLLGRHNLSNVYAAWLAGRALGMTDGEMRYAVEQIEPVEHRLQVRHAGGMTIIDDAFNSNPEGAAMALEVLAGMGRGVAGCEGDNLCDSVAGDVAAGYVAGGVGDSTTGNMTRVGRRIVVTPGMVELGARQAELNREFGRRMAASCDFAIVVGEVNRQAIVGGLLEGGFVEASGANYIASTVNSGVGCGVVIVVDTFAEAVSRVRELSRAGDVILYENDLPDTFR